jgi:general secretion pathway protein C
MQTPELPVWWLRSTTFTLTALTAASVAYWVLQAWSAPARSPQAAPEHEIRADTQLVAQVLGGGPAGAASAPGAPPAEALASHFKLSGVVADRLQGGYALIAVDEEPAKPYRVGEAVGQALVLHSVTPRSAALAPRLDAPVSVTLELPAN